MKRPMGAGHRVQGMEMGTPPSTYGWALPGRDRHEQFLLSIGTRTQTHSVALLRALLISRALEGVTPSNLCPLTPHWQDRVRS